jgi:3-methyladenine DNA glycosylase/8-oxoguanine DNA glycosylase
MFNRMMKRLFCQTRVSGSFFKEIVIMKADGVVLKTLQTIDHIPRTTNLIYVDGKKKISINGIICGLSESKLKYIQDLTDHFLDSTKLLHVNLHELNDIDLRNKLLNVKGLGLWSVDMFMLFDLHRSNILPIGDIAVGRDRIGVKGEPF